MQLLSMFFLGYNYARKIDPSSINQKRDVYKSIEFNHLNYIGDPINTVRMFNDKNGWMS